jgi:uncharacterized LabA/DUF88 family protein
MQLAQNIAVLVDAQNLYYSYRRQYNGRVDYGKLLERVAAGRPVVRAIAYVICSPETDATNFLTALKQMGFEVKCKPLKVRPDGSVKGDWDMGIALDALAIGQKVDTVCLVSGDSDFADLVVALKTRGVRCEAFGVRGSFGEELQRAADAAYYIDEYLLRPMPSRFSENGNGNGHRHPTDDAADAADADAAPAALSGLRGVTDVPRFADRES